MAARNDLHVVYDPPNAQVPPPHPVEFWTDIRSGRRYRRHLLGACRGGRLVISDIQRVGGLVDLYFRRTATSSQRKPQPSELDDALKRLIETNWRDYLHKSGRPVIERQGSLWWLTRLANGFYGSETTADGASILYRYAPLIQRPRSALPVKLAYGELPVVCTPALKPVSLPPPRRWQREPVEAEVALSG